MALRPRERAYLIVICDPVTNSIKRVEIWSSPEWQQSRRLLEYTYIAYWVEAEDFHNAQLRLLAEISCAGDRYNHLVKYMKQEYAES